MGIHGLLPFLKQHYVQKRNIKDFAGKTVGVDAMCWMHKGAFACAVQLVLEHDTDKFVHFFLKHCEMMRYHNIKPVIVFDGARLPAKAKEEANRQATRDKARDDALAMLKRKQSGEFVDEKALFAQCSGAIRITGNMIARLMRALRELSIHFIVAPFEADAQLAYMCRTGWVHAVISEDSDLLAYGCPNTFFKMDTYGDGENIVLPCLQPNHVPELPSGAEEGAEDHSANQDGDDPGPSSEGSPDKANGKPTPKAKGRPRGSGKKPAAKKKTGEEKKAEKADEILQLNKWSPDLFSQFCTFCGTDYKEPDTRIKGFGVKTAFKLLCQHGSVERVVRALAQDKRFQQNLPCPVDEYVQRFNTVLAVFWHHTVFDPRRGECLSIAEAFPNTNRTLQGIELRKICGDFHPKEYAGRIARGEIDARTLEPRPQEPFTPAERACIERMLRDKREQQRDHQFRASLKEDAERAAKAREAAQAAAAEQAARLAEARQQSNQGPANPNPVINLLDEQGNVIENLAMDPPNANENGQQGQPGQESQNQREMRLLKGDISVISGLMQEVFDKSVKAQPHPTDENVPPRSVTHPNGKLQTPPRANGGPEATPSFNSQPQQQQSSTPAVKTNPFARKRLLGSVTKPPVMKRPRASFGTALKGADQKQDDDDDDRRLIKPEYHPRGGYAAFDAAAIVLANRRGIDMEKVEEAKNPGKLGFFFKAVPKKSAVKETPAPPKLSKLSEWRARPWEPEEPEPEEPIQVVQKKPKFWNRSSWEKASD
uniref:Exonuclease 1 n=1 Tax=Crypthecodinium cohnii TaxID=2866 RepID=A0A516AGI6_CRYCO|nr:exonuclease 1 [Crypthecodinium cohnii]USW07883.1 exonuclease 1 [Crypthecodinium cohnii]